MPPQEIGHVPYKKYYCASDHSVEGPGDGQSLARQQVLYWPLDQKKQGDQPGEKSDNCIDAFDLFCEDPEREHSEQPSIRIGCDPQSQFDDSRPIVRRLKLQDSECKGRSGKDHAPHNRDYPGDSEVLVRRIVLAPVRFIKV